MMWLVTPSKSYIPTPTSLHKVPVSHVFGACSGLPQIIQCINYIQVRRLSGHPRGEIVNILVGNCPGLPSGSLGKGVGGAIGRG